MAHAELNPVAEKTTKVHIAPAVTHSLIDAARTSVAVMGDTFEAFSLVQAFLDKGVPPDSIILLFPQDPNADVDPLDKE